MSPNVHWAFQAPAPDPGGSLAWPTVVLILGVLIVVFMLLAGVAAFVQENRKLRVEAAQQEAVRQLVARYEQLSASTLDAQQRVAADTAEVRSRLAAIEQVLRSVE